MPKKQTIRFYTASDRYSDWKYLSDTTYFDIINWTRSGNYILINEQRIDKSTSSNQIFVLLLLKRKK
jgi:hypothetical protein